MSAPDTTYESALTHWEHPQAATIWWCSPQPTAACRGKHAGKPPSRCPACRGLVVDMRVVWGVWHWTGADRYRLPDAVRTYHSEAAAEAYIRRTGDDTLVVRYVTAPVHRPPAVGLDAPVSSS